MFQVKTVLFPVDFSAACAAAADPVASTAAHFGAKLLLFHVVQMPPAWYGDAVAFNAIVDLDDVKKDRQAALDAMFTDRDDVAIQRIVAYGEPAQSILECARKERVDLIMMPTHGCGPFRRFLLGSVTAKVLHDADRPVWTDAHQPHVDAPEFAKSVLCATDLKPEVVPAIQWAAQFAMSMGLELRLVHAVPWYEDGRGESASLRHVIEEAREAIGELEQQAGVGAAVCIKPGNVAEVLREAALKYDAHTIVIGQGSLHRMMGRLRSNAYAIIREAPCPVVRC